MSTQAASFWGIKLSPGTRTHNMVGFYLACFTSIMLATFVPQVQPFLLTEVLEIPKSEQGVLSGNLNFIGEMVIIVCVGFWGSLSDKIGRRAVATFGYLFTAAGIMLYGLADSTLMLAFARATYAAGFAAISTILIALMADYALDKSRGKATGFLGMMNGLGAMVAALFLLRLPALYQGQGFDAQTAALASYATMALVSLLVALALFLTLRPGLVSQQKHVRILRQLREGFSAAKDPGVRLAYAASFVARANLAVVGTFFTLWASLYGTEKLGITTEDALVKAGLVLVVSYVASLISAPIFGIMCDRLNRVTALAISLGIGFVGYCATFFFPDPFSLGIQLCMILIGMAEVGCIITSGVLIAQQSPDNIRGSVVGAFTLSGAIGILVASLLGGYLVDHWLRAGPFVFIGLLAGCVMVWALVVRKQVVPITDNHGIDLDTVEAVDAI